MKTRPYPSDEARAQGHNERASGRSRWVEIVDDAIESARKRISNAKDSVVTDKEPKAVSSP
jgi:hypothetical protein